MARTLLEERELHGKLHAALRAWKNSNGAADEFLDDLLLIRSRREAMINKKHRIPALRLATNEILHEGIISLEEQDETAALILRERFINDETLAGLGHQLNLSEFSVSRKQREAIVTLSQIIWKRELLAREAWARQLLDELPPPSYSKLFGVKEAQAILLQQLLDVDAPAIIAVEGLGGIGKTSLADSVVRQAIQHFHFEHVVWLFVEQPKTMSGNSYSPSHTFEMLLNDFARKLWPQPPMNLSPEKLLKQIRAKLIEAPHLIVIDNLESEADLAYLLAQLPGLTNPSRFLITTRAHPLAIQTAVYRHSLQELSYEDAADLIRYYAQNIGINQIGEATDEDIAAIYDMTGGNPKALQLVVSMLDTLPLPHILDGFTSNKVSQIEEMYRYIYWQAWQTLGSDARNLLQAMPLVSETGATPEYLQTISGVAEEKFWPAVHELRSRSLIEVRGSLREKRYGLHRLTDSFLRNEIVFWADEHVE